jgi:hypothetical protein
MPAKKTRKASAAAVETLEAMAPEATSGVAPLTDVAVSAVAGEHVGTDENRPEEAPAAVPNRRGRPKATRSESNESATAPKVGRVSALDAAARVLGEAGLAMSCQEMITAMAEKGYWTSPGGKTPSATLCSAILRELQIKGPISDRPRAARLFDLLPIFTPEVPSELRSPTAPTGKIQG